jgi:hypothetical protein
MKFADCMTMGIVGGGYKGADRGKYIFCGFAERPNNAEEARELINNEYGLCVSTHRRDRKKGRVER